MKVVGVGDNCIDYYIDEEKGYPGGNPVNVLVYMRRYHIDCSYIGAIGNDDFGQIIMKGLNFHHINTSHVSILEGNTARSDVCIENGNRVFKGYDEGVLSQFVLSDEDICYIETCDMMVTSIWSHVEHDLHKIHIPIAFDMSDQLESPLWDIVLSEVDYVFYSDDQHNIEDIKQFMKEKYMPRHKVIVCTRGEYGSIAYDGHEFYEQDIIECHVVDTMGAGDSFIAGYLSCCDHADVKEALYFGACNSAKTIEYKGAWAYEL